MNKFLIAWLLIPVLGIFAQTMDYRTQLKNRPIISIADAPYNAKPGTDISQIMNNITLTLKDSGGGVFIPYSSTCYYMQNVSYYGNMTFYSDNRNTCLKKPAGSSIVQMFTSIPPNGTSADTVAMSNVHFRNLTIDGNKAAQTGLSPTQNGLYNILMNGCSGCSIENVTLKDGYTDDLTIDGAGTTTVSGVANSSVTTTTITNAVYTTGLATYTSTAHGLKTSSEVDITGISPSGYNQTCFVTVVDANTFTCTKATNPGAYSSGGSVSSYYLTYVSGTNFSTFAPGSTITIGASNFATGYGYPGSATTLPIYPSNGSASNITWSTSAYVAVGSGVLIENSTFTGSNRNNISLDAGINTWLVNVVLSNACGASPQAGIDVEPYGKYGSYVTGLKLINVESHHNCGNGIDLNLTSTYDINLSPVLTNINSHDNAGLGLSAVSFQTTGGTLTVSGQFINNAGCCSINAAGWANTFFDNVTTSGSQNGIITSNPTFIGEGTISGTVRDLSTSSTVYLSHGDSLVNATTSGTVYFPLVGIPSTFINGCIFNWPSVSPRRAKTSCSAYSTISDDPTFPGIEVSNGTITGGFRLFPGDGVGFTALSAHNAFIGANNASNAGTVGNLHMYVNGGMRIGRATYASLGTAAPGNIDQIAIVADSTTQTNGAEYTGGGALSATVKSDGSHWWVLGK